MRMWGRLVHPRARGEHFSSVRMLLRFCGSSPRSRGTPIAPCVGRSRSRFIPALAGNTAIVPCCPRASAVHPRARGEHRLWLGNGLRPAGSSPRSRGTLCRLQQGVEMVRFIPALAGNTPAAPEMPWAVPVHPRARGEHERVATPPVPASRFIPALAGNTTSVLSGLAKEAVHPRARGEHLILAKAGVAPGGSSPRSRGTPGQGAFVHQHVRFIPALAGNTWACSLLSASAFGSSPRSRGTRTIQIGNF